MQVSCDRLTRLQQPIILHTLLIPPILENYIVVTDVLVFFDLGYPQQQIDAEMTLSDMHNCLLDLFAFDKNLHQIISLISFSYLHTFLMDFYVCFRMSKRFFTLSDEIEKFYNKRFNLPNDSSILSISNNFAY